MIDRLHECGEAYQAICTCCYHTDDVHEAWLITDGYIQADVDAPSVGLQCLKPLLKQLDLGI